MLTWLLATEPTTTSDVLARIVAHPKASPAAVTAALTHPAYPADAHLPAHLPQLGASDVHTVLTHPTTSTERRRELLNALHPATWFDYVSRYTTLTTDEIAAHSRRHGIVTAHEHNALLRNPHTPPELTIPALAAVAGDRLRGSGPNLALHAARHRIPLDYLWNLANTPALAGGTFHRYVSDYAAQGRTALEYVLDLPVREIRDALIVNPDPRLMVEALKLHPHDTSLPGTVINSLGDDTQYDPVRQALGHPHPGEPITRAHLRALMKTSALLRPTYLRMFDDPDLSPEYLTEMRTHLILTGPYVRTDRQQALTLIAAHPNCPTRGRSSALAQFSAPRPGLGSPPSTEEVIARTLDAGQTPTTDIALPKNRSPALRTIAHHLRPAVHASSLPWPLNPTETTALLELEPGHTGTLADLHATAVGIGA